MTLQEKIAKNEEILVQCKIRKENLERQIEILERKIQNQKNALLNQTKIETK